MALVSQISTWNKHGTSQQLCFQKRRQLPPKKLCQFWGIHIKCVNRKKKTTWMSLTVARRKEFYLSSCKMILGHLQAQRNQDGLLLLFSETEVKWYILQNLGTGNCSHCRAVLLTVPDWWARPSCPVQSSATEDKSLERSAHWNRFVVVKRTEQCSQKTEISRTGDINDTRRDHTEETRPLVHREEEFS